MQHLFAALPIDGSLFINDTVLIAEFVKAE